MTAATDAGAPGGPRWDAVVGQPVAVRVLTAALRGGQLGHAWLFVGRRGVGQTGATRALAAALNCPRSDDPAAGCGSCHACLRIARGTHAAVRDLAPEGAFHRVGAVREEWIPAATTTPVEGRTKVLRVLQAGRMNESAQNAFLKILEEPPRSTVWILEAEDDHQLLDTVVSRCRRIDFTAPGREAMVELATRAGIGESQRDVVARAAMGSPARLRSLARQGPEPRRRHQRLLGRLAEEGPGIVPEAAAELRSWAREQAAALDEDHDREAEELLSAHGVERQRDLPSGAANRLEQRQRREKRQARSEALDQVLDDLGGWLRDVAALAGGAGAEVLVNLDSGEQLRRDASRLGLEGARVGLSAISRAREALEANGHEQLQLERLLLVLAVEVFRERERSAVGGS